MQGISLPSCLLVSVGFCFTSCRRLPTNDWTVEASRGFSEAFDRLQVAVRIYGRFDVALLHPQHFVVVKTLKATA